MTVCGGWSLVNLRQKPHKVITLRCRSWSCPDCAPLRRWQLRKLAMSGKPTKFLTLTIKQDAPGTPEEHAAMLADAFRKLVKRWRRHKPGSDIAFLAVFEPTKKGQPHLHVMLRAPYTRQEWLSKQMQDLLDSPIVDIRAITDRRKVGRYVSKYITKSNIRFGTSKRYWASPKYDIESPPKPPKDHVFGSGWSIHEAPAWLIAEQWATQWGYIIHWLDDGSFEATHQ